MTKFTLADLKPTTAKLELTHPTQGKTGVFIELTGQDSVGFRNYSKKLMKQRLAAGKDEKIDVDQMERSNAELAAVCIKGWDEEVFGEYTPEKAKEIMLDPELAWIREEVERFIKNRENFFRRDSETTE